MEYTKIKNINEYKSKSINPMKTPDTVFEMYSVPTYGTGHPEYLSGSEIGSNKVEVQKNDVLLCKINPRINRVWVVADESGHQSVASSEWIVVRNSSYNPEFLAWYFRSPRFRKLMTSEVTGIGGSLTRAQPKAVAEYPVPVMDRGDQDRYAEILNRVNSIIEARKREIETLDYLIKARFVEMFKGGEYDSVPLIETVKKGAGLSYGIVVPGENVLDGVPMVRPSDFRNGQIDLSNVYRVAPEIEHKYSKTRLIGDEVLVQVIGQPGQVMLATEECAGMNVTRNLAVIRPNHKMINRIYLKEYIEKEDSQQVLLKNTKQSTLKQLPLNLLKQLDVQLPPMELQEEFADFVQQVDKSKVAIQKSLKETQLLFDSLMQDYFG